MTLSLSRVLSFAGRHWLRLLIIGGALFVLTRKQVNFNVRLGSPSPVEEVDPAPIGVPPVSLNSEAPVLTEKLPEQPIAEKSGGLFERFSLFGGSGREASAYDQLTRLEQKTVEDFIRRFSNVAQAEQEKFGVPSSITLANALLHTRAGSAPAARDHNNFFALGCDDNWPGSTGRADGKCIRRYETAWTSFRDHSLYVTSGRYAPMTQFGETDYQRWAAGLGELGFNDTDDLSRQLLRTIDRWQLFRFD